MFSCEMWNAHFVSADVLFLIIYYCSELVYLSGLHLLFRDVAKSVSCFITDQHLFSLSLNRKIAAAFKFVQATQNNGTLKGSNSSGQASGLLSQW